MKNFCVIGDGYCEFTGPCMDCKLYISVLNDFEPDSNDDEEENNTQCDMRMLINQCNIDGKKTSEDMVNHPEHYKTESGLEAIDVIKAFTANLQGIEAVDTANILKYACRWKKKNGVEDLKKIRWYVNHLIKHLEPTKKTPDISDGGYFKCPVCGGKIKSEPDIFNNKPIIQSCSDLRCIECGRVYIIRIEEDLTVNIELQKHF